MFSFYNTPKSVHYEQNNRSTRNFRRIASVSLSGMLIMGCETTHAVDDEKQSAIKASPIAQHTTSPKETNTNEPSRATHLFIENETGGTVLDVDILPLDNCLPVIDPPREGDALGATYQCMDYATPSNDQDGLSILAGHSSSHVETDFNDLYRQGDQLVGDTVHIKTNDSDKQGQEYTIHTVLTPSKQDLPYMAEVWGAPGEDVDDKLVLVTCLQNPDGSDSTNNFIALAEKK